VTSSQPQAKSQEQGREGLIVAHYGVAVEVRFSDGESQSVRVKRQSGHVVGDEVLVRGDILQRLPRRTEMCRRDVRGKVRLVAANLDVVGIVVSASPPPPRSYVDRAIVAAKAAGIHPFLVVNKMDLPSSDTFLAYLETIYQSVLTLFPLSASSGHGLDAIRNYLSHGHRCAFVGTSGVGKSSLLNALVPGIDLLVGELSEDQGLGRHTTTVATLHALAGGGELVDTPGFRDFGLVDVAPLEMAQYFPGFEAILETPCRFRNCYHQKEPGCSILKALQEGVLDPDRYESYLHILEDLKAGEAARRPY